MRNVLSATWWLAVAAIGLPLSYALRAPSTQLYLQIVQRTGELTWTEYVAEAGLIGLLFLAVLAGWRARSRASVAVACLLIGGPASAVAYAISEAIKSIVREPRGCWELVQVASCPVVGDWSFPSNHTTIAFAMAATVVLTARADTMSLRTPPARHGVPQANRGTGAAWLAGAGVLATVTGAARIAQGAHFPHDVLAGALLGVCVVTALVLALRVVVSRGVDAARRKPFLGAVLGVPPAAVRGP